METAKPTQTPAILPRLAKLFRDSNKLDAITKALYMLSLVYQQRIDLTPETQTLYLESLESLTPEQLASAFSRAQMEPQHFFPTPGELRALAGCETARRRSEREASEGMVWILEQMRRHGSKLEPRRHTIRPAWEEHIEDPETGKLRRVFHEGEYETIPCHVPEPIELTLRVLGNGDREDGLRLLSLHPGFAKRTDEDAGSGGQRIAAIERYEQRWVKAWEIANRERSTALEVAA